MTASELKKEIVKYLKSKDPKHPFLERIKDMNENRLVTIGKYMYVLNHGGEVPDEIFEKMLPALEKIIVEEEKATALAKEQELIKSKEGSNDVVVKSSSYTPTIQDRIKEKACEAAGEVEGWIDDFCLNKKTPVKTVEEFVNLFKVFELKAPHTRYILTSFSRRTDELERALEGKDKDLSAGYSHFTKPELKKFIQFHQNLLQACDMLKEAAKVQRAPKKKKPVSQDKLVAKVKFKKEDNTLGIVSMAPIHLLGAKEVWVYNSKTRKLAQYKSIDADGFSVKGTSLLNYSPESVEKTLRKPAEQLAEFKKASKVKLRTFLKEIKAVDITCNGRLTEHHVILRIDK
jgi:hypothetical protein